MCMQLAARVGKHELEEFFASMGKKVSWWCNGNLMLIVIQVKSVRMITDKNSRRSKGIAYVEFIDFMSANEVSVTMVKWSWWSCDVSLIQAIRLSGTKLFGVPIMIQPTMSEKNRCALYRTLHELHTSLLGLLLLHRTWRRQRVHASSMSAHYITILMRSCWRLCLLPLGKLLILTYRESLMVLQRDMDLLKWVYCNA